MRCRDIRNQDITLQKLLSLLQFVLIRAEYSGNIMHLMWRDFEGICGGPRAKEKDQQGP